MLSETGFTVFVDPLKDWKRHLTKNFFLVMCKLNFKIVKKQVIIGTALTSSKRKCLCVFMLFLLSNDKQGTR